MDLQPPNPFPSNGENILSDPSHPSSMWSSAPQYLLPRQGPVLELQDDYIAYRRARWSRKVVATLVDRKDMPIFHLQAIIDGNWNLQDHVLVKSKHNKSYILELANAENQQFMLSNGPWAVQQSPLVLEEWQPEIFSNLIGDLIGGTVKLDPHNDLDDNLEFLRVKASLDKTKPLFMGAFLPTEFGEKL
ncbi:uncharacterized protein G2W53_010732 [Senna tora]|uniref:DUF4283 domain-containing protein n=1 Tax=Senna tora TaxID=362788 RepID=A0A834X1K4_9FABA|nr:uncharacterized protein G2W53_010732 [Senna tora]